jgi:hypothetical protein
LHPFWRPGVLSAHSFCVFTESGASSTAYGS